MNQFNIGLIGLNFGIKVHYPSILKTEGFKLSAICCRDKEKAEVLKEKLKMDCKVYCDPFEMIACKNINLVDIVSPPTSHSSFIKESIRNNKHIICEKPFGLNFQEIKDIKLNYSKKLYVNYFFRTETLMNILKDKIINNELGRIDKINIKWNFISVNKSKWKLKFNTGGSIIDDVFCHTLNYLNFLLRSDLKKINKFEYNKDYMERHISEELSTNFLLKKKICVQVDIKKNFEKEQFHKIEVIGQKKRILLNYFFPFTPTDKELIIFNDEKIEDKVTGKKKIVIDDRIECFKKFLSEFKKKKSETLCNIKVASKTRFDLDIFKKLVKKII